MDIVRENLTEAFVAELSPLLTDHIMEIRDRSGAHGRVKLDVNWSTYHQLNTAGLLWVFSARDSDGLMVGYVSYIVEPSPHCVDTYTAHQDAFYVMPPARGQFIGPRLLSYAEEKLKPLVSAIRQAIPVEDNFSPMLVRKGYELTELIYTKRL